MSINIIFWHIFCIAMIRNLEQWLFLAPFFVGFRRRDRFWPRLILFFVVMYATLFALSYGIYYLLVYVLDLNTLHMRWMTPLLNVTAFLFMFGLFKFCFNEKIVNLLFVFSAAQSAGVFTDAVYSLLCLATGSETLYMALLFPIDVWSIVFYVLAYGCVIVLLNIFFARAFRKYNKVFSKNINIYVVIIFVIFSLFLIFISKNPTLVGSDNQLVLTIFLIFVALFALLIVLVERFMLVWMRDWVAKGASEQFLKSYKDQIEMLRKNMDIVNIKCHDMKHQIGNLLKDKNIDEHYISEVNKVISIYDTAISTGNEHLNVLLSQKMLFCGRDKIELSCMIDGAAIAFMAPEDMNSFFGNAIDNAMESLLNEPEENRFIRVLSSRQGSYVTVTVENYCTQTIHFARDGLPVTSKKDKDYHGFGVKSIAMIVNKYGGKAYFNKEGKLFVVSAVFKTEGNR